MSILKSIKKLKEKLHKIDVNKEDKWLWEFSKKVISMCVVIYIAINVFALYIMYRTENLDNLSTLISETSTVMRDCVFAYMIKAGVENYVKISKHFKGFDKVKQQVDEQVNEITNDMEDIGNMDGMEDMSEIDNESSENDG